VADDVVLVARDALAARDVADQAGGLVDEVRVPRGLAAEAGVLDADGEVVAAGALDLGNLPPLRLFLYLAAMCQALLGLLDELRDLGAVLLDHVVGADAGLLVGEPAPAAGVGALAGVDDDDADVLPAVPPGRALKLGEGGRSRRRSRAGGEDGHVVG
jgi:hypothetical protein